jgi:hypothetical protein
MALPRNQSSAPRAFSGKTVNVVSQNWGGYVAQQHGVKFRYVRAAFSLLTLTARACRPAFPGIGSAWMTRGNGTVEQDGILAACQGTTPVYSAWYENVFGCYWMAQS